MYLFTYVVRTLWLRVYACIFVALWKLMFHILKYLNIVGWVWDVSVCVCVCVLSTDFWFLYFDIICEWKPYVCRTYSHYYFISLRYFFFLVLAAAVAACFLLGTYTPFYFFFLLSKYCRIFFFYTCFWCLPNDSWKRLFLDCECDFTCASWL